MTIENIATKSGGGLVGYSTYLEPAVSDQLLAVSKETGKHPSIVMHECANMMLTMHADELRAKLLKQ